MTESYPKEVFSKAFKKAISNGWDAKKLLEDFTLFKDYKNQHILPNIDTIVITKGEEYFINLSSIIYDKDFAKALWNSNYKYNIAEHLPNGTINGGIKQIPEWQYHLQQLVVSDNPFEYLENNI